MTDKPRVVEVAEMLWRDGYEFGVLDPDEKAEAAEKFLGVAAKIIDWLERNPASEPISDRNVSDIVRSTAEAGGDGEDVAILLADIAAKVLRIASEPGRQDLVIDDFIGKLRDRMTQLGELQQIWRHGSWEKKG